jgi:hypothetical protein
LKPGIKKVIPVPHPFVSHFYLSFLSVFPGSVLKIVNDISRTTTTSTPEKQGKSEMVEEETQESEIVEEEDSHETPPVRSRGPEGVDGAGAPHKPRDPKPVVRPLQLLVPLLDQNQN